MAVALALAAPFPGSGAEPSVLVGGDGNQTAPSMEGQYLAYLDDGATGVYALFLKDLATGEITRLTEDGNVLGVPEVAANRVAYRTKTNVEVYDGLRRGVVASVAVPGAGRVALSSDLVAWDEPGLGGGDVAWQRFGSTDYHHRIEGLQGSVAASFGDVAYVDGSGAGTVHVVDASTLADLVVYDGSVSLGAPLDVAIYSAYPSVEPVMAVTLEVGASTEIAVVDLSGAELARLTVPGPKRNIHLLGDWVGFEDLSLGVSQVFIWNWADSIGGAEPVLETSGPPAADQVLHEVVEAGTGVKVVWASLNPAQYDIFEWDWVPDDTDPGPPPTDPVECSDTDAIVVSEFTVVPGAADDDHDAAVGDDDRDDGDDDRDDGDDDRDDGDDDHDDGDDVSSSSRNDGWHLSDVAAHDESWHSLRKWRSVGAGSFDASVYPRVLVCIEATDVISGWVAVASRVVASPSAFGAGAVTLEARLAVRADDGRAAAVILAKPGASLRVRVLADPGGDDAGTCSARGDCPAAPRGLLEKWSCASGGGSASLASLLLAGFVATRPLRRRSRR